MEECFAPIPAYRLVSKGVSRFELVEKRARDTKNNNFSEVKSKQSPFKSN